MDGPIQLSNDSPAAYRAAEIANEILTAYTEWGGDDPILQETLHRVGAEIHQDPELLALVLCAQALRTHTLLGMHAAAQMGGQASYEEIDKVVGTHLGSLVAILEELGRRAF